MKIIKIAFSKHKISLKFNNKKSGGCLIGNSNI